MALNRWNATFVGLMALAATALAIILPPSCSAQQITNTTQVYETWATETALPLSNLSSIRGNLKRALDNNNPFGLYDLQFATYYQLIWLQYVPDDAQRRAMLDDMVELYALPLPYRTTGLDENGATITGWICKAPPVPAEANAKKCDTTLNTESFLYSVQYLYGATKLLHNIGLTPQADRSPAQNTFVQSMAPVIISHFDRWLTGCSTAKTIYSQFRLPSCAAASKPAGLTDEWMQVTGALSELQQAAANLPALQAALAARSSSAPAYEAFLSNRAFVELKARTKEYPASATGQTRAVFDAAWAVGYGVDANGTVRGINRCAYNTASAIPQTISQCPTMLSGDTTVRKTTLDISHYVRVAFLLESLATDGNSAIRNWVLGAIPKFGRQFSERVVTNPLAPWQLANFFGDSKGDAPSGWARVFFNGAGTVLPYCNDLPAATRQKWINCAPYNDQPPGSYSLRPGYFTLSPYAPGLRSMGQNYFLASPPSGSDELAIRDINTLRQ